MMGLYRTITKIGAPLVRRHLRSRAARGKEDPGRIGERLGHASKDRPAGDLVWLHAASIGESASVLPLITQLLQDPALTVLVTSGTVTSASMLGERLPDRAFHQYVPVDLPDAIARFLDHWKPDLAILVESELWPNMISETQDRGVPMVMVQGRLSEKSSRRWRRLSGVIRPLLSRFRLILAQTEVDAERFRELGASAVGVSGTLKFSTEPLPAGSADLSAFQRLVGARPLWLAASTHEGEEDAVMTAHIEARLALPELLTIIVPRHPERANRIADIARDRGLSVARRTKAEPISPRTDIYLADTLGELGLFYRVAPLVFVGGSLVDAGGHNLIEPIQLGGAVVCGPHLANMAEVAEALTHANALRTVDDGHRLGSTVGDLLCDAPARSKLVQAQSAVVREKSGVLDAVMTAIKPYLPRQRTA
jgi:3-deoxy-D-manno-octulosonic-acid transferase